MIKSPTLFILGAGSSNEAGLPLGSGLAKTLRSNLDFAKTVGGERRGSATLLRAIKEECKADGCDPSAALEACGRLNRVLSVTSSIDRALHIHEEDKLMVRCGKLAIADAILKAEGDSTLAVPRQPKELDLEELKGKFYGALFSILSTGVNKGAIRAIFENVRIISFNYDRTLEHYLFHALQAAYQIDGSDAADVMSRLLVAHPYGQLGNLPWQRSHVDLGFGADATPTALSKSADQLRTFTEGLDDILLKGLIQNHTNFAKTVVILGFSFEPNNLSLLTPNSGNIHKVLGTAYKLSEENKAMACDALARCLPGVRKPVFNQDNITLVNSTCSDFLHRFEMPLQR